MFFLETNERKSVILAEKLSAGRLLDFVGKDPTHMYSAIHPEVRKFFISPLLKNGFKEATINKGKFKISISTYFVDQRYFLEITLFQKIKKSFEFLQRRTMEVQQLSEDFGWNDQLNCNIEKERVFYLK